MAYVVTYRRVRPRNGPTNLRSVGQPGRSLRLGRSAKASQVRILPPRIRAKRLPMESGIYALYWWEQDLIYIGQAQVVSARFKEHKRKLKAGTHPNYRVQDTYNLYGEPDYITLELCPIEELNTLEIAWTVEFDSVKTPWGLNLVEAGMVGWGTNSNNSKYTKQQILRVFSYLYRTNYSHAVISKKTKVSKGLIASITVRKCHLWLRDSYPEQYAKMLNRENLWACLLNLGKSKNVTSPEGQIYTVDSVSKFCDSIPSLHIKGDNAKRGIARIIDCTRNSYLGWKLA